MIRRGFWLTVGAVTGIIGYRRVCAAGRRISASLSPAGSTKPTRPGRSVQPAARSAVLARETIRFTRDVREGMELYRLARSAPARPALPTERPRGGLPGARAPESTERPRGGLPGARAHKSTDDTDHDARPEDGR